MVYLCPLDRNLSVLYINLTKQDSLVSIFSKREQFCFLNVFQIPSLRHKMDGNINILMFFLLLLTLTFLHHAFDKKF